jgi:hypothetical protein
LRDFLESRFTISLDDKMFVATILATAVLQYQSTPWLREELQSSDVLFFGAQDSSQITLDDIYICAPLLFNTTPNGDSQSQRPSAIPAPNTLLYSLGVMLIELALERPVSYPEDNGGGEGQILSRHQSVKQDAQAVSRKLGTRYGIVVQRCLECRFDTVQSKLEDEDLQRAFYSSVICELDRCLQAVSVC